MSFDFYILGQRPMKASIKLEGMPTVEQIDEELLNTKLPTKILIPGFLSEHFTTEMVKGNSAAVIVKSSEPNTISLRSRHN